MTEFSWGAGDFPLHFAASGDAPVTVACAGGAGPVEPAGSRYRACQAMVEVLVLGQGRGLTSARASRTAVGDRLRYVAHATSTEPDGRRVLTVRQRDGVTGLEATTRLERFEDVAAYRATTTLHNGGDTVLQVQAVSSLALGGLTRHLGAADGTRVWTARNEWCSESRWSSREILGADGVPDINPPLHGQAGRGVLALTGTSTWSSGEHVPVAALTGDATGRALVWQIESNGPWRWEIGSLYDTATDWLGLVLSGPTDLHHGWTVALAPGEEFTSVPVSIALSGAGLTGAVGELTRHRRASHLPVTADAGHPLIFNDYMNALMGDPTAEKLLPLIDAAAAAGAQYFCIDAGWYDDGGNWWPSVGAWEPSTKRFGELGLTGVLQHIRDAGMLPGLWVEPEVIGVRSPKAAELPEDAFMRRGGVRIVEDDRYFLDLRSQAARDFLDGVFRRLIEDYGARYFKWDYNVTPGSGPDADATGPGDGLLRHARTHLAWFESLRERYPDVIFEACSSGAQRMDGAILSRYDLQSTSDQQDYRLYPTIAAGALMAMPPEQAGNWAYPQPEMDDEQVAFNLVTGLSGRLYLSGHLNLLGEARLAIVKEATSLYPQVIAHHAAALPVWPLGLPEWRDPVVAVGSATPDEALVFVWNRDEAGSGAQLRLEQFRGEPVTLETVFPTALPAWGVSWDAGRGVVDVDFAGTGESARVLRVRRATP